MTHSTLACFGFETSHVTAERPVAWRGEVADIFVDFRSTLVLGLYFYELRILVCDFDQNTKSSMMYPTYI